MKTLDAKALRLVEENAHHTQKALANMLSEIGYTTHRGGPITQPILSRFLLDNGKRRQQQLKKRRGAYNVHASWTEPKATIRPIDLKQPTKTESRSTFIQKLLDLPITADAKVELIQSLYAGN